MNENELLDGLTEQRLLPLIDSDAAEMMPRLATVLRAASMLIVEVTLRRPRSLAALHTLARNTDLLVGAGTVMDTAAADAAVNAGARFLVSPGYSPAVAAAARRLKVELIPGIATATEMMTARAAGCSVLKFFPAQTSGGTDALRALSALDASLRWVPTGGITASTAREYLAVDTVTAVGGSWMTPRYLIDEGDVDAIARLVSDARAAL